MQGLKLAKHGACHVPSRGCSLASIRPARLAIGHRNPVILQRRGAPLRMNAGRAGPLDDDPLPDDDFLPADELLDPEVDLDKDEAAILLGAAGDSDTDDLDFEHEEGETEEELARRRTARARGGRVVDAPEDEYNLDMVIADAQRGAPLRSQASLPPTPDFVEGASDSESFEKVDREASYPSLPERRRSLPELLRAAGYASAAEASPAVEITNIITCNSESSQMGSLYVCVPCEEDPLDEELDGHNWADEAAELGAVAVIASKPLPDCLLPVIQVKDTLQALGAIAAEFYDHPAQRLQTVAFVGSYGKTTAGWLARGILEEGGELVGMIGDSEYSTHVLDDYLTQEGTLWEPSEEDPTAELERSAPFRLTQRAGKYELPPTTPDALHLQKVLAGIADRGANTAIVEVSPGLAADGRADTLKPAVVVFTNIDATVAAADPQGLDAYVERVSSMFENLNENQTAIINLDDPYGPMLARLVEDSGAQLLTYGITSKDADVYAEKTKPSIWETEILVRTPVSRLEIILPLVGSYNVSNALAAVAVGLATGVKLVSIVAGIEAVSMIPGRTEVIDEGQPFPVIVDSAKTPEQIGRLIDEVKEAGARRTILVVGCKGGTSAEERAAIGSVAHFKADVVFFTNDSPGLDAPNEIISDIVNGLPEEVLGRHAGSYYPWLQDVHRTPQWYESWLLRYQSEVGRYIIEDRFSAIRVAIGLAKARDVVLVVGRGQDDRMEVWDGIPPPRSEEERAVGEAAKSMAESVESPEYVEETNWEAIDKYYEEREKEGFPIEPGTVVGWFNDAIECRSAIGRLAMNLNKLKDLDRSTLPWTRYPEEREQSGISDSMGMVDATSTGNLDQYLRSVVEEVRDSARTSAAEANGRYGFRPAGLEDDSDDEEEEEEIEEEAGAF